MLYVPCYRTESEKGSFMYKAVTFLSVMLEIISVVIELAHLNVIPTMHIYMSMTL